MSSSVVPDGVAGEPPRLKSSEGTREEPEAEDNNAGQDPLLQESAPIRNETLAFDCDALKRTHERDVSFKKRLREKFVGRQAEKDAVLRCYESSASEERMSLLLVTGPTGVGKTTLITKTLKDPVERQGGFLLTGKFDQLQHRIPHKAFVSILSELAFQVRDRGKSNVQETQTALQQALTNEEASLLTELIPELEGLVGDHIVEPVCKSKAELSPNRFIFVLKKLLRAICSPNRPLILVFEDIHWADPHWATNLMRLVTDCAMEGLFLVGTFDDSAVTDDSYLSQKLRDMEKNEQVAITRVNVGSLNKEEILEWICELFPILGAEQRESFARSVKDHSEGNHCRIVQYVDWLEGSGFLKFEDKSDSFELEKEQVRISPDFDFLADKIERLSIETREVVKFAACLGYSVDDELIEAVVGYPVDGYLAEAAKEDVLVMNDRRGVYAFMHDSMHDAVLRLIPENEREHFHAEVGRQMWRNLDNEDFDRNIFLFLSQMNLGKRFLRRDTEKHAVASFCLQAGKKAARYSTFRTAAFYLRLGTDLLSDRSWDDEYDLTLALHSAAAEIEMCTANFERMDELVEKTLTKAKAPRDKIPVYGTRMSAMSVNDRQLEALRLGMDGLRILGERFPRKSHTANSLLELIRVKRLLRGKSNEQLLKLPLMEDEDKLTCMQILQLMFLPAALHDPMIFALVILRTVKLTLRHGLSAISVSLRFWK
jgi:predicted ATPase